MGLKKLLCKKGWHKWDFVWIHNGLPGNSKQDTRVVGYEATCRRCGVVMKHMGTDMQYRLKY